MAGSHIQDEASDEENNEVEDEDGNTDERQSLGDFGVDSTSPTETPASITGANSTAPYPLRADGGNEQLTLDDTTLGTVASDNSSEGVAAADADAHQDTTSETESNATAESEPDAHAESESDTESDPGSESESKSESESSDPLCIAYRHDVHKLFGRSHDSAHERVRGVRVNEPVPLGADGDAAFLSRPAGKPGQTVKNHCSPIRLSLLTGSRPSNAAGIQLGEFNAAFTSLIEPPTADQLHAEWLTSSVAGVFCESVYYPYTSLTYHTLLVTALLDNYRAGYQFSELSLVASPGAAVAGQDITAEAALASDAVRPHRTVCWTPALTLHVTGEPGERPATPVGEFPVRSFADVWSRLPEHPLDVDHSREARLLDAQLRRIRSWSTALQYVEDVAYGRGPMSEWGGVNE